MRVCSPHSQRETEQFLVEGWKRITNYPYVLSIVAKGYRLRFTSPPLLRQTPWEIRSPQGPEEILGMREQITLMLQKNVITEVPPNSPGFYSNVFLVRKASGGWGPVIHAPHFRMFTTSSVLSSVRKGDYAFKIDLQDAYFHVPIHPSSRKYVRFAFENKVYQFRVLPFGLNTAPQVFTRLGHTVTGYLHRQGISVIPYLDDWLIHHPDRQVLLRHQAQLINTLDLVGFILNRKKFELDLTPVSRNPFTSGLRGSFPSRVQSLGDSCSRTPSILPPSTNLFSSVPAYGVTQLGLGSYASGSFVPETSSTSFSLITCRSDRPVYTTASIRPTGPCQPSTALAGPMFSYLRNPYPHVSGGLHEFYGRLHAGVGRSHGDSQILGTWTRTDRKLHISCLELKAVVSALKHWAPMLQGHQVMIATDNSTVVSYINKQGGTHSPTLLRLTVELLLWLEAQNIIVQARHIPGCLNVIADHLSRPNQPISTEWSLKSEIVKRIFRLWGTPEFDMFATVSNSHLPRFMSPVPEP